ncbi:MAG TPA: RND transporter [Thermoanaerobaculia bacterium]|nr:RND transporter [Thermoanaerobaculia bacterium]
MKLIAGIPFVILVPLAVLMALAPFGTTPHFIEKWRMLFSGTLHRPLDWFDLLMHTTPLALLALKIILRITSGGEAG